jgi:hypothetical protein
LVYGALRVYDVLILQERNELQRERERERESDPQQTIEDATHLHIVT